MVVSATYPQTDNADEGGLRKMPKSKEMIESEKHSYWLGF
jgi:hypothetical protein